MFTREELDTINTKYFQILQLGGYAVTLKSRYTGHCWHIVSQDYVGQTGCQIFHTHKQGIPYHEHGRANSLKTAIKKIKNHDAASLRSKDAGMRKNK